jgi:hypothetical protein
MAVSAGPHPIAEPAPDHTAGVKRGSALARWTKRLLTLAVGAALTGGLIGSAFYRPSFDDGFHLVERFPLDRWFAALPSHLPWLLVFAIFSAGVVPLRAWKWGYLLGKEKPRYADRYHAVAFGLLAQNVIPGKMGEPVRAYSLSRFSGLPFFRTLGTIAICKLSDLFALVLLVLISPAGPIFGAAEGLRGGLVGVGLAVPVLVALLVVVAIHAPRLAGWLESRNKAPRLSRTIRNLAEGIRGATPRGVVKHVGATLVAIASVGFGYTVALHGTGVENVGLLSGVVVLAAITLGQAPPGVPAGLGMYYLSCSWAARMLGASAEQAATIAVLTHLATVFSHAGVGFASVAIKKVKIADFVPRRKVKEAAAEETPAVEIAAA